MRDITGYKEVCGIIQNIAIELITDENVILTDSYYIGYVVAFSESLSKKEIAHLLAEYMKNYSLDCIEIFDTEIFRDFIFKWDDLRVMNGFNPLSYEKMIQYIGENFCENS